MPDVVVMSTAVSTQSNRREPLVGSGALLNAVALAMVAGAIVAALVLFLLGGWDYYRTPLSIRGYAQSHKMLRPSGVVGHSLGIAGTLMLFSTLLYLVRKKAKFLARTGSVKGWLEFHIFCGVFGPILITLHTSLKFNGVVSVAYWSMVLVVASGFVGRYLYVRIPKTIRGKELTRAEIEQRARELKAELAERTIPQRIALEIEELEKSLLEGHESRSSLQLLLDSFRGRLRTAALRRRLRRSGLNREALHRALDLMQERASLLRRIAHLKRTTRLFQIWHVFHRPLVWVMFLIFFVHLGVAIYFGYTAFSEWGNR